MQAKLRVLFLGDSEDDTALLRAELCRASYDVVDERVETAEGLRTALDSGTWDAVLADSRLATVSVTAALEVLKATGQDLPFIIITDLIGEGGALAALTRGAHDVLVNDRLARLAPALERALRDGVTRRERAGLEAQLKQSQKMEGMGQLASGIAHDFNNLLTAILGFSELVQARVADDAKSLADLQEITKAAERAAALTRQLLAFSRKQLPEAQIVDINRVVVNIDSMLRRVLGNDVRLETSLSDGSGRVKANLSQIEQVLVNLAINARDAMPRGGTLAIHTGCASPPERLLPTGTPPRALGWVSVVVRDSGCGMSPETQARIFEPFFTTKKPGKGTGLGLSTVYGIVAQSEGCLAVESSRHTGTAFTIYLPAVPDALPQAEAPRLVREDGACHETILVADDDQGLRQLVRRILRDRGYRVLVAADGLAAVEMSDWYPGPIDLLLTDLVMPALNGPDVAQRILDRRARIGVLYMFGFTGRLGVHLGSLSSGIDFLHKPFTPEGLLRQVRMSLDRTARQVPA